MPMLLPMLPEIFMSMVTALPEVATGIAGDLGAALTAGSLGGALGDLAAIPMTIGGALGAPLAEIGTGLGLSGTTAAALGAGLSPELVGAGLGYGVGGTKGILPGILGGLTMGGGLPELGAAFGAPPGLTGTTPGLGGTTNAAGAVNPMGSSGGFTGQALQAAQPFISGAMNQPQMPAAPPPVNTITPQGGQPTAFTPSGGGPSGLSLGGNSGPDLGPWHNWWGGGGGQNTPMMGTSGAPATSSGPSSTQQSQFIPSP